MNEDQPLGNPGDHIRWLESKQRRTKGSVVGGMAPLFSLLVHIVSLFPKHDCITQCLVQCERMQLSKRYQTPSFPPITLWGFCFSCTILPPPPVSSSSSFCLVLIITTSSTHHHQHNTIIRTPSTDYHQHTISNTPPSYCQEGIINAQLRLVPHYTTWHTICCPCAVIDFNADMTCHTSIHCLLI